MRKITLLILLFQSIALQVSAFQTIASGEWNNPAIWDLNEVPGPNDPIVINHQVYSDQITELTITKSLQIKPTGQLNIKSIVVDGTLTNSGLLTTHSLTVNANGYMYNYGSSILIKCENKGFFLNEKKLQVNFHLINEGKVTQKSEMVVNGYLVNNNHLETTEYSSLSIEDSLLNNGTIELGGRIVYPATNKRKIFKSTGTIIGMNGGIASKSETHVINEGSLETGNGEAYVCLPEGSYSNSGQGSFTEKCCFMMHLDAGVNRRICAGESTILGTSKTIYNGQSPFNIEWFNEATGNLVSTDLNPVVNPSAITVYKLLVEDDNGCLAEDSVIISPQTTMFIRNLERYQAICQGESVNLGDLVQVECETANYTYQWSPTNFLDDPTKVNAKATPSESTIYRLEVMDVNGNALQSTSVAIFVDEKVTTANAGDDQFTCGNNRVQLAANDPVVGVGRWNLIEGSGNIINNFNPAAIIFNVQNNVLLEWKIRGFVCESIDRMAITFLDSISRANAGPDQELYGVTSTHLEAIAPTSGAGQWSLVSGEANIVTPGDAGSEITDLLLDSETLLAWQVSYGNTSTVDPAASCPANSDTMMIKVYAQERMSEVFVPDMFTPNQDGQNDVLFANGYGITELLFRVFDRTGKMIFETQELGTGWNGQYNGQEMPADTYVFYVRAISTANQEIIKKGSIQLVR